MTQQLIVAITEMREEEALKITTELLDHGVSPADILGACKEAMDVIGKRFECGEAFIPELMLAGEMMTAITSVLKPRMAEDATGQFEGIGAYVEMKDGHVVIVSPMDESPALRAGLRPGDIQS